MTPVPTARGLVRRFATTTALDGVDLDIAPGECLAVMGPSGSGKSTLLHVLAGILVPDAGTVDLGGRTISAMSERERSLVRRSDLGFVFQFGQLLSELPAVENVALPAMLGGAPRRDALALAGRWMAALGLVGKEARLPGELSGGEAQRVAVARALITGPSVVFADEPTGSLDQATGAEVMGVLTAATRQSGAALVVVTHDPLVAAWCGRRVDMRDGRVIMQTELDGAPAGALSVVPVLASTGEGRPEQTLMWHDVLTGGLLTLAIAFVLAAVSGGIAQAAAVLDRRRELTLQRLAGVPVGLLDQVRRREVLLPLLVVGTGSAVAALALLFPLFGMAMAYDPGGPALLGGSLVIGTCAVLLATETSRPLLRSVLERTVVRVD